MKKLRIVPSWLRLEYPITKYAQDANAGIWWDITKSDLTTPERALAASLRWRWHALNHQSDCAQQTLGGEKGRDDTE